MSAFEYTEIVRALNAIATAIEKLAESNIQAAQIRATENPNFVGALTRR